MHETVNSGLVPQFNPELHPGMPKVVIAGNYYGSKTFPSLNNLLAAYAKMPKAGGALKRKFQNICSWEIREQLGDWKPQKPLIGHFIYHEPKDGHYRDRPNIHFFASKVFWDSMQDCRVIPNDDPRYVLNETHDFYIIAEGEPYIEIYLEEVEYGNI